MNVSAITPGLTDPVHTAQSVFRSTLDAMAHPGRLKQLPVDLEPPAPLFPTAAAVLLTLADFETPIWLDARLDAAPAVAEFLRFHTGAPIVRDPARAAFAIVSDAERMPALAAFAQGTPEYPDRSTTLVVQADLLFDKGWTLNGPGIEGTARFSVASLPADFLAQLSDNRAQFPRGVDLVFVTKTQIAALPRTTAVIEDRH